MFSMLDINDISTVQDFHHRILLQSPTDTVTTPQGNTYLYVSPVTLNTSCKNLNNTAQATPNFLIMLELIFRKRRT